MQKLHLVGFTTDLDGLIFSARKGSKAGGYLIPLDKELMATIAEAERLRNGEKGDEGGTRNRARPDSRLTPREIQAHLRAGRSIPEVAAEAGVDIEWVERFAVPIVAEQAQMVERARAMTYSKARLGQSTQPLGTSVRWNLADKGVAIGEDAFEQGWSAFQLQDEVWMIRFRYTSRARLQVAEWELDLDANHLLSRNRLASELGYVEKGRRPPALPAPAPRSAASPPVRVVEETVAEEPEVNDASSQEVDAEEVDGQEVHGQEVQSQEVHGEKGHGQEVDGEEVDSQEVDSQEVDSQESRQDVPGPPTDGQEDDRTAFARAPSDGAHRQAVGAVREGDGQEAGGAPPDGDRGRVTATPSAGAPARTPGRTPPGSRGRA